MAKRAAARKGGGKTAPPTVGNARDRMVDAALRLWARQGWQRTGMAEIAAEAGLSLAEAYAACPSKLGLLAAFHRRLDQAVLSGGAVEASEPARDRLFDVLMRRFDALQPHRAAVQAMVRGGLGDPALLLGLPALLGSMAWMLEAAGISNAGWRGRARSHLLAGLYLSVLREFLADDSNDLTRTMAALDRRLRQAEAWLGLTESGRRRSGDAAG
jgi:AcrR family transcriptional regulator